METRRPIKIRDITEYRDNQEAVTAKFVANSARGKQAFLDGTVKPFSGYSKEALQYEFQSRVVVSAATRAEVGKRVINPLVEAAHQTGNILLEAGVDIDPAHITMGTGRFNRDMHPEDVQLEVEEIIADERFLTIRNALIGRSITLNGLVCAPNGSIYICSREVSEVMYRARTTITNLLKRKIGPSNDAYPVKKTADTLPSDRFSLVDYKDITHSTVARLGIESTPEDLHAFYKKTHQIARDLSAQPIQANIVDVYFGTSFDVVSKIALNLITQP